MDPRLMPDLYEPSQPVDLYGTEDELFDLPMGGYNAPVSQPQNISQKIQEILGAKEPDKGGMANDILSARFNTGSSGPSFGDYAQGVVNSATGSPQIGNPSGTAEIMKTLAFIKDLESQQATSDYRNISLAETMRHNRASEDIMQRRYNLENSGTGKPPSGYRWLPDGSLEPIPGGPGTTISAELAARLGLANKTLKELGTTTDPDVYQPNSIKDQVSKGAATGPLDYTLGSLGLGEAGAIHRRIADGADALQRMLTGAGMPMSEAEEYTNRFRPTWRDDDTSLMDKLNNMESALSEMMAMATRGKGGSPASPAIPATDGWSIERID